MNAITALSMLIALASAIYLFASLTGLESAEDECNWGEYHEIRYRMNNAGKLFGVSMIVFVCSAIYQAAG